MKNLLGRDCDDCEDPLNCRVQRRGCLMEPKPQTDTLDYLAKRGKKHRDIMRRIALSEAMKNEG